MSSRCRPKKTALSKNVKGAYLILRMKMFSLFSGSSSYLDLSIVSASSSCTSSTLCYTATGSFFLKQGITINLMKLKKETELAEIIKKKNKLIVPADWTLGSASTWTKIFSVDFISKIAYPLNLIRWQSSIVFFWIWFSESALPVYSFVENVTASILLPQYLTVVPLIYSILSNGL